jgi:O-antigen ligase
MAIAAILAGSWRQRLMFVVSAMVALICVYVATPLADLMFNRPSLRLELWSYFLWMASERPWLGVGLTFDVSLGQMLNAHNIILSALVRGGIFAAVTLISLIVVCLYQSLQAWRRGALLVPVALMTSTILATAVDYEIIATSLGWQWLLFWLPVGMCLAVGPQASWQARSLDAARATIAPRPSQAG